MNRNLTNLGFLALTVLATACGKSGTVNVSSAAYTPGVASLMRASTTLFADLSSAPSLPSGADLSAFATATTLDTFNICVTRVRLDNENDEAETSSSSGDDKSGEMDFRPGVIDLKAGAAVNWGKMEGIPVGFKLKRIRIKVHKDSTLCSAMGNHSIEFQKSGGALLTTQQDVEFKWRFSPAIELKDSDTLNLKMSSLVADIIDNASDEASLKSRIEAREDDASKK